MNILDQDTLERILREDPDPPTEFEEENEQHGRGRVSSKNVNLSESRRPSIPSQDSSPAQPVSPNASRLFQQQVSLNNLIGVGELWNQRFVLSKWILLHWHLTTKTILYKFFILGRVNLPP